MSDVLRFPRIKDHVCSIISDRYCGAIDVAAREDIPSRVFQEANNENLSNQILDHLLLTKTDYLLVMFSRLLKGQILEDYRGRIFNFHPGLLPAFIGIGARNRAFNSTVRFLGNTCHLIDESIDGGAIVQQSIILHGNDNRILAEHELYVQHCKMIIQLIEWLIQNRISFDGERVNIVGAQFKQDCFSPNLDSPLALNFEKDLPDTLRLKLIYGQPVR